MVPAEKISKLRRNKLEQTTTRVPFVKAPKKSVNPNENPATLNDALLHSTQGKYREYGEHRNLCELLFTSKAMFQGRLCALSYD
jgi:hypothetical protein